MNGLTTTNFLRYYFFHIEEIPHLKERCIARTIKIALCILSAGLIALVGCIAYNRKFKLLQAETFIVSKSVPIVEKSEAETNFSDSEIQALRIDTLTKQEFDRIFRKSVPGNLQTPTMKSNVSLLLSEQIDCALKKGYLDEERICELTDGQVSHIMDMSILTQEMFNALFCNGNHRRIQLLQAEQIEQCIDKFDLNSITHITIQQIRGLDLSKLSEIQFDSLFPVNSPKTKRKIQLLSPNQLQDCYNNLGQVREHFLSDKQKRFLASRPI